MWEFRPFFGGGVGLNLGNPAVESTGSKPWIRTCRWVIPQYYRTAVPGRLPTCFSHLSGKKGFDPCRSPVQLTQVLHTHTRTAWPPRMLVHTCIHRLHYTYLIPRFMTKPDCNCRNANQQLVFRSTNRLPAKFPVSQEISFCKQIKFSSSCPPEMVLFQLPFCLFFSTVSLYKHIAVL